MTHRLLAVFALAAAVTPAASRAAEVHAGSKTFTESVILGEMLTQLLRDGGADAAHRRQLGGTRVLWNALQRGEIDAYVEYSGTLIEEIFAGEGLRDERALRQAVEARGVRMSRPLGFNNTYVLGMKEERARELGVETISDLRRHPGLAFGFSNEFMDRGDGWPSLKRHYRLPHEKVTGLDHDLAYRGLEAGTLDVIDLYATDAEIRYYGLRALEDDLGHFPAYHAVILYRADLADRAPDAVAAMLRLEGAVSAPQMIAMNARVKIDGVSERRVAADFVAAELAVQATVIESSTAKNLVRWTLEHLWLVGISLLAAILVAIPLGILAFRLPRLGQVILAAVGVLQTLPSLALLVFMIPLFGIGGPPAIVALFLYSLLPIVRNTHAGLSDIPRSMRESAQALGLPALARLRLVELPLALRSILAGIKTSAVINVGTATLGALIGAGGYGQPILTGIRLDDTGLILQGAVPAAGLALAVQGLFEIVERLVVPRGLRLRPGV